MAAPGRPRLVAARSAEGRTGLDVSFRAPFDDGGSPLTGYQVRVDTGDWEDVEDDAVVDGVIVHRIRGLEYWQEYDVSVRAVNADGQSPAQRVAGTPRPRGYRIILPGDDLPLRNVPVQAFAIRLSGVDVRMAVWYQEYTDEWYATIEAPAGTPVVTGRRLVPDLNLLIRVAPPPLPGSLFVRTLGLEYQPVAGAEPWGNSHALRYEGPLR